jgi:hypothetical protein
MCVLNFTIILCCILDSEIRWHSKDDYEDVYYNFHTDPRFYILNFLRIISMVCVVMTLRLTYVWYETNVKKLKQRNKLSQSAAYPMKLRM